MDECAKKLSSPASSTSSHEAPAADKKSFIRQAADYAGPSLVLGLIFGFLLEKSKVYLPGVIRDQFYLANFTMFKVFMAAMGSGMAVVAFLESSGLVKRGMYSARALGFGQAGGHGANALGGLILGAGMVVAGACPGVVLAQAGAGMASAFYVVAGGMLGVLAFSYMHAYLTSGGKGFHDVKDGETLDQVLAMPFWKLAGVIVLVLAAVVVGLEKTWAWDIELAGVTLNKAEGGMGMDPSAIAWSPPIAGLLIGLLQLPSLLMIGKGLGASSSYVTLSGFALRGANGGKQSSIPSYFSKFMEPSSFGQVFLVFGVILGAFISTTVSGYDATAAQADVMGSPLKNFVGGFMLLFGARLAGGCTSGHGLTGMAHLALPSMAAVVPMFIGGFGAAAIMG